MENGIYQTLICIFSLVIYALAAKDAKQICTRAPWKFDSVVVKSTGTTVKIAHTTTQLELTWFEAASCCRLFDFGNGPLTLMSVTNMADFDGYVTLKDVNYIYTGWTDIHGFGKDWRNLKGTYITDENVFFELPRKPASAGKCKSVASRSSVEGPYYTNTVSCYAEVREKLFCEYPDPLAPTYEYDCDNKYKTKEKAAWYDEKYWEDVLRYNAKCEERDKQLTVESIKQGRSASSAGSSSSTSLKVHQEWKITPLSVKDSEGEVVEIKNVATDKCVDNFSGNVRDRNPIIQYGCKQTNGNQQWVQIPSGTENIYKNKKTRKCITQHKTNIGASVMQKECNQTIKEQQWTFNNGQLISKKDSKCLEVPDGYPDREIILRTSTCAN